MGCIDMILLLTCSRKWWYLIEICFVLGENFWLWARDIVPLLSSHTLQCITGVGLWIGNVSLIPSNKVINGITSLSDWLKAIYSTSTVDSTITEWNLLHQVKGHPVYVITYPVLDITVSAPIASALFQSPAKSASTKH